MSQPIRIACAQLSPVFLDKKKTVAKAIAAIHDVAKEGANLVVFPEAFISGYPDWIWTIPNSRSAELNELYVQLTQNSVSVPDDSTDELCKAAKEAKVNVVMGINERNTKSSNGSLFNSMLFINEKGDILGTHQKLIPTGGERLIWARGDGRSLHTYKTSSGVIGGLICWENLMPLARVSLYKQGLQILASPTWDKSDNWLVSMKAIAREGGVFVISSCMALRISDIPDDLGIKNSYPEGREWINPGNSCIISPNGKVLAGPLNSEEGILYADIDLDDIIRAKRMFDVEGHYSRPDVFDFKIKQ